MKPNQTISEVLYKYAPDITDVQYIKALSAIEAIVNEIIECKLPEGVDKTCAKLLTTEQRHRLSRVMRGGEKMLEYQIFREGNMYFATDESFTNLQESHVEFGETPNLALAKFTDYRLRALLGKEN